MAAYTVEVTYGTSVTSERVASPMDGVVVEQTTSGGEFERFEDLARKLVKVPKRELDEKRQPA